MLAQIVLALCLTASAVAKPTIPIPPIYNTFFPGYHYTYPQAFYPVPAGQVIHNVGFPYIENKAAFRTALSEDEDIEDPTEGSIKQIVLPTLPAFSPIQVVNKFHGQDGLGGYNFGFSGDTSSRHEIKDASGVIRGAMNYIDAEGKFQTRHYVADANGFRVVATDLPKSPVDNSKPVEETEENRKARARLEEIRAGRTKRSANFFYSTTNADTPANTFRAVPHNFAPVYTFPAPTAVVAPTVQKGTFRTEALPKPTFYSTPFQQFPFYNYPFYGQQFVKTPATVSHINHSPGFVTYKVI